MVYGALSAGGPDAGVRARSPRLAADHLQRDDPVHGRDDRSVHRRTRRSGFALERRIAIRGRATALRLRRQAGAERDAYAAIYRKAPVAEPSRSAGACGRPAWRLADHRRQCGGRIQHRHQPHLRHRGRRRLSLLAEHASRASRWPAAAPISASTDSAADVPTCSRPAPILRHTVGSAYISAALAYGWQDVTTDRTVTVAGVDQLRAQFNANAWSGRVEGGYRFVTPWIGDRPHALCRRPVHDLRSAGLCRKRRLRRQHLRAGLWRQERHDIPQRTRSAQRQILCDAGRDPDAARPRRLGA